MYLKKKRQNLLYIKMLIVCGPSKHIFIKKNQAEYVDFLQKKTPVVIASGPAGTGKTMFACKYAIESLVGRKYDKLIITRPTVPVGEEMGFLPGDIDDKMKPWMIPIYDQLEHFSNRSLLGKYFKENTIEIVPFAYIRGRTFDNTLIIADEMQNSTHHQMYTTGRIKLPSFLKTYSYILQSIGFLLTYSNDVAPWLCLEQSDVYIQCVFHRDTAI